MTRPPSTRRDRILRFASGFALLGLALMVWSVLDPRWFPVMLGLSLGQAIGTASFALYLVVVAADLGVRRRLHREKLASEIKPLAAPLEPVAGAERR